MDTNNKAENKCEEAPAEEIRPLSGKTERNKLADCLKGYACLLVLFGHVIMGVRKAGVTIPPFMKTLELLIWTFHVALFMFISGYVYKITGEWQSKGTRSKFVLHKLFNLGVPYFIFSVIYIVINSFIPEVNNPLTLSDILWLWREPLAQYWFLYTLFNVFVIFTVLSGAMKNWQITLVMLFTAYLAPLFNLSFGSFVTSVNMCFSFGLGASLPSLIVDKYNSLKKWLIVIAHIVIVTILITTGLSGKLVINKLEIIFGIFASIALISLVVKVGFLEKFLLFVNKHSFSIYVLHTIFTAGIRIILNRIGIENYWIHIFLGTIIGLLVPVAVSIIAKKTVVFEFFFYPSRTLKKLKAK